VEHSPASPVTTGSRMKWLLRILLALTGLTLLAASISEAMNCTAFGLMAAIPLLLFHARLMTNTGKVVNSLEMASVKALNTISNFAKRLADRPPVLPGTQLTGANHDQAIS
jgi:hypothetical protein